MNTLLQFWYHQINNIVPCQITPPKKYNFITLDFHFLGYLFFIFFTVIYIAIYHAKKKEIVIILYPGLKYQDNFITISAFSLVFYSFCSYFVLTLSYLKTQKKAKPSMALVQGRPTDPNGRFNFLKWQM
jgi:Ni/Fe-hydrogenase subunit HybB-like protein